MIKYRALHSYRPRIEALEIVRETATMYVYVKNGQERRERPHTEDPGWFDDFDSAKEYLEQWYCKRSNEAFELLEQARSIIDTSKNPVV